MKKETKIIILIIIIVLMILYLKGDFSLFSSYSSNHVPSSFSIGDGGRLG